MSSPIISVKNIGKKYQLGATLSHDTLRDNITYAVKGLFRRSVKSKESDQGLSDFGSSNNSKEFWAIRNINFDVNQGEVIGIIGRNGAGKSTLLKIVSQVTEPTEGEIYLKGRVASLLEVGTGFHPELSGRENIYMNGVILGMTRAKIKSKFDEIVTFSEVEKFIDTPVKRYSSGMKVRLAFAVAAHLEPEILVVDEVLAVGDAEFQKKCLGKMGNVAKEGRTILFVSHNMNAVERLCEKALLIEKGRIKLLKEDVPYVVKNYLFGQDNQYKTSEWINSGKEFQNSYVKPLLFSIVDEYGNKQNMPMSNDKQTYVRIEMEVKKNDPALTIGYAIYSEANVLLYWTHSKDESEDRWPKLEKGLCVLSSKLPKRFLNEGCYTIELIGSLHFRKWLFEPGVNAPSITMSIQGGLSDSPLWMAKRPGLLAPVMKWRDGN